MTKLISLILIASALLLAGCCAAPKNHSLGRLEYMEVASVERANEFAAQGWVVAGYSVYQDAGNSPTHMFLLKRPKKQ